jgi:hypothetical protein
VNENEYRKLLSGPNYDFLFDCGVIIRSDTAKLEQIRMGLCTLNFIKLMEKYPEQIVSFQPSTVPLSGEQLEDMFM